MAGIDLSGLSDASNVAKTLSNLILVTPQVNIGYQPQSQDGTAEGNPFLFHYTGEEQVSLKSDITDHVVEDNTTISDQISLRPETFTVSGIIGELNNVVPDVLKVIKAIAEKLAIIGPYAPAISATAIKSYNQAEQLYRTGVNIKKNAVQSWESLNGKGSLNEINSFGLRDDEPSESQTEQQIAFQKLYGYWRNRTLFTIQTPWAIFKDMAIEGLRVIQDDSDVDTTDFEITFKIIRFAQTELNVNLYSENSASGRNANQKSSEVNFGTQTPTPSISLTEAIA